MAARTVTADELIKLRRDNQFSKLYLAIHNPAVVFSARLTEAPGYTDQVVEISYYGGSGTLANVKPDMTLWVGSTAGAYDRGQCRIRLDPDGDTFFISEAADIDWQPDDYLTVVDEFGIWPRHMRTVEDVFYVDWDIPYSDQHDAATIDPVPAMLCNPVAWIGAGGVATVTFDASASWRIGGGAITYAFVAPGASATSGLLTATPTISYNAPGTYRVALTVTSGGRSFTAYRYVFVFQKPSTMPVTQFKLDACSGDAGAGGWSFRVTLYDEADIATVRERAMVILFAEDFYGDEAVSLGPVAGRENVIAWGWIATESITRNPEQSSVSFEVQGPHWWLDRISGFPVGFLDVRTTPTRWTEFLDLTVDKALFHLLRYRTTALRCIDTSLTGDTRLGAAVEAPFGSLWRQIAQMSEGYILANPRCDRYGMLYVEIDAQYVPVGSRAFPTTQTLAKVDLRAGLTIDRSILPQVGILELSGVFYTGTGAVPFASLANGHTPKRFGSAETVERLIIDSQTQCNELAGLVIGQRNNLYPRMPFPLAANNRFSDITPRQYVYWEMAAADSPRGVAVAQRFLPRRISLSRDPENGMILVDVEGEGETVDDLSVTKPIPPANSGEAGGGDPPEPSPDPGDIPAPGGNDLVYVVTG